jgi:hypothetical protein
VQSCGFCEDAACGDNTNPTIDAMKADIARVTRERDAMREMHERLRKDHLDYVETAAPDAMENFLLRSQVQRLREAVAEIGEAWEVADLALTDEFGGEFPDEVCRPLDRLEEAIHMAKKETP